VKDEAIYRCIHAACARALPRPVNFCPYCGTGQHAGVDKPAHRVPSPGPQASPVMPAAPQVEIKPHAAPAMTPAAPAAAAFAAAAHASTAQPQAAAASTTVPPPGPAAGSRGAAPSATPRPGAPPAPPRPPERQPIRLRWWLLALAALWAIWLLAKPSDKKIEARIDKAIALAVECKSGEAQSELIALRSTKATPQQLARLQQELNDAAAECKRVRQRGKAWSDASAAVESALGTSSYDRARSRLSAFTRRWGEDDETRALKAKVDAVAPREHPLATPSEP
jgi:hypothetical protein